MQQARNFAVILEPEHEEGGYTVIVPALPGVIAESDTLEEAPANAQVGIRLCLEDLAEQGLDILESDIGARLERVAMPIPS